MQTLTGAFIKGKVWYRGYRSDGIPQNDEPDNRQINLWKEGYPYHYIEKEPIITAADGRNNDNYDVINYQYIHQKSYRINISF